jgi:nucleotide-binding universal stress UspA family protein
MGSGSISHILVPTDLSEFGSIALRWALRFGGLFGARVTLLHVTELYPPIAAVEMPPVPVVYDLAEVVPRIREALKRHAVESAGDAAADIEVRVEEGPPAPVIAEVAKQSGTDLVIMGTHGRRGWRRLLLGSITESVLVHLACPVLTVRETSIAPAVAKIVCPVNLTPSAGKVLDLASEIARKFEAQLIVVHVSEPGSARFEEDFQKSIRPIVRTGNAAEEVLELAEEEKADLIVVGAVHKRFRDATVIGTTTTRVVRFADRPVLIVPAREDA